MRTEQEIFADLGKLCRSPGYVHALAYICFKDNFVLYAGELTGEDAKHPFSKDRLIRTEISTLIGLLVKGDIDYSIPTQGVLRRYVEQTYELLEEMHHALSSAMLPDLAQLGPSEIAQEISQAFSEGVGLREPMFYSGESAYSFQFRDLSVSKYAADNEWLESKKGFTIQTARDVVQAVQKFLNEHLASANEALQSLPQEQWTLLPGFSFDVRTISATLNLPESDVESVLNAFALPEGEQNQDFNTLHDFNATNATPLLRRSHNSFVLFEQYSLVQALYEAPFYWMISDAEYVDEAMRHRGDFTENFSRLRLERVFAKSRVHQKVEIYRSKDRLGEIDVLVTFGDHAIVLQAKSKRLTLEARRGNTDVIRSDFQRSVQDAYDQGFECANLLTSPDLKFIDSSLKAITIPQGLKEIYILCVVSDHYPALSFQARAC